MNEGKNHFHLHSFQRNKERRERVGRENITRKGQQARSLKERKIEEAPRGCDYPKKKSPFIVE